jgi:hypothetical protein
MQLNASSPSLTTQMPSTPEITTSKQLMQVTLVDPRNGGGLGEKSLSLDEVGKQLQAGRGIAYQFSQKSRKRKYFKSAEFIALQINEGIPIDAMLTNTWVKQIGGVVCTASKSPASSTYLWVIQLPRAITDADELKWCRRALANYFQLSLKIEDEFSPFAVDGAKLTKVVIDRSMNEDLLNFLIEDGQKEAISDTVANGKHQAAIVSAAKLHPSQIFVTSSGYEVRLDEISKNTSVRCPFHSGGSKHSFVSRNNVGKAYHYCSTCNKTRWESGGSAGIFSSDAFEAQLVTLAEQSKSLNTAVEKLDGLRPFIQEQSNISVKAIDVQSNRYLKIQTLNEGVTFIKSAKGTGKTEAISRILKAEDQNATVLLIGHRQSLIKSLSKRFGLNCYLDFRNSTPPTDVLSRYGVCLDSLMKVEAMQYDLIVIDEVEQVLAHFLSETMTDSALEIFSAFRQMIGSARKVVVMDADLGWTSFLTLVAMAQGEKSVVPPVQFVVNTWQPSGKSVDLYTSKEHLIGKLIECLEAKKRVFVASNSKAEIDRLVYGIRKHWDVSGADPIRLLAITSENSVQRSVQDFIGDIKNEILKYDLVLSSPSMSTGVDITFDFGEAKIDAVFGLFETRINIHTEIDQQLSRVRNPKEMAVWISPARFNFETQFEVVRSDTLRSKLTNVVVPLVDLIEGVDFRNLSGEFLTLATLVTVGRRASINALRNNFIEYKRRQGVAITPIAKDLEQTHDGASLSDWGKQLSEEAFNQSILTADEITFDDFKRINQHIKLDPDGVTPQDKKASYRHALEWFYLQPVTRDWLEIDDRRMFRKKMNRFYRLTHPTLLTKLSKGVSVAMNAAGVQGLSIRRVGDSDLYLLKYLFSLCPFVHKGSFIPTMEFSTHDLKNFGMQCKKLKQVIEGQLDLVVRSDIEKKPVSQLKQLLRYIGLDLVNVRAAVHKGEKTYLYKLDAEALAVAMGVSQLIQIRMECMEFDEDNE